MANFSVAVVEALDYDFTGFPSNSGSGMCKGKGTVPEPSQPALQAYQEAVRALFKVDPDAKTSDVEKAIDDESSADDAKQKIDELLGLTAELCQNSPSKDELSDLPPRIRTAYTKWLFKELSNPEV